MRVAKRTERSCWPPPEAFSRQAALFRRGSMNSSSAGWDSFERLGIAARLQIGTKHAARAAL